MATMSTAPGPGLDALGEGIQNKTDYESEAAAAKRRSFRPDIQGLRAVAVTLVVLYHCGVTVLDGGFVGVDVFFVVSGFLITLHLVSEVERTGRVSISGFYARRIRRLLPPALIVVAVTIVVARVWGPSLQSTRTAWDGLFATFYAMNYRLADQGVDYQQADATPSPFQHFWSLAVEEQYYVIWPLLILVLAVVTRRVWPALRRGVIAVALVAVIVVSLHESITMTASNGPLAYYSLQTRAWELAAGALIAVLLPVIAWMPRFVAAAATWAGMAMILWAAATFDESTAFPGSAAAIPVGGAALVIAGGIVASPWGVVRVLRGRITQFIGHVSYGWYLWHWPVIILGPAVFGKDLSTLENLELSVLALWFAVLTFLLVEQPTLRLRFGLKRWLGVAAMMSAVVMVLSLSAVALAPTVQGSGRVAAALDLDSPASQRLDAALAAGVAADGIPDNLDPELTKAAEDRPTTTFDGCHLNFLEVKRASCVFGDAEASRTMVLFGDSHAQQWFGALDELATTSGWRLVAWTKAACPVADVVLYNENIGRSYTECGRWRTETMAAIDKLQPDLVVASQADTLPGPQFSDDVWGSKTASTIEALESSARRVAFITDTPRPARDVPGCLADHPQDISRCSVVATSAITSDTAFSYLTGRGEASGDAAAESGASVLDPSPWMCSGTVCPTIVGNALVYRDASHITDTYSRTLAPILKIELADDMTP